MEWENGISPFIELHYFGTGLPVSLNAFCITSFGIYEKDEPGCYISLSGEESPFHVTESYDEVKEMLETENVLTVTLNDDEKAGEGEQETGADPEG